MSETPTGWEVTPKPVPVELEPEYPHEHFPKRIHWAAIGPQIESATWEQLKLLANGGTGNA